jgi:DNA polymerase I-like protein with 3'-5' exonuclease and polymerase domains
MKGGLNMESTTATFDPTVYSNYFERKVHKDLLISGFTLDTETNEAYEGKECVKCKHCVRTTENTFPDNFVKPALIWEQGREFPREPVKLVFLWDTPNEQDVKNGYILGNDVSDLLLYGWDAVLKDRGKEFIPFYTLSALACVPQTNPSTAQYAKCGKAITKQVLDTVFSMLDPTAVIVPIGAGAYKALHKMYNPAGTPKSIKALHGQPESMDFNGNFHTVIPIFSPSYYKVSHNAGSIQEFTNDLRMIYEWVNVEQTYVAPDFDVEYEHFDSLDLDTITHILDTLSSAPIVTFDVETNNLSLTSPYNSLLMCGFGYSEDKAIVLTDTAMTLTTKIFELLHDKGIPIVAHNSYFDIMASFKMGLVTTETKLPLIMDTKILAHLVNEYTDDKSLKGLAESKLQIPDWSTIVDVIAKGVDKKAMYGSGNADYGTVPRDTLIPYNAKDVVATYRLCIKLLEEIEEVSQDWKIDYVDFSSRVNTQLIKLSMQGMRVDLDYLTTVKKTVQPKLDEIVEWFSGKGDVQDELAMVNYTVSCFGAEEKDRIYNEWINFPIKYDTDELEAMSEEEVIDVFKALENYKFNSGSSKQIIAYLAHTLPSSVKMQLKKSLGRDLYTATGGISVGGQNIEKMIQCLKENPRYEQHYGHCIDVLQKIIEYRDLKKQMSTYIDGFVKYLWSDSKMRPQYLVDGTRTGRLSSKNPNGQNIPRDKQIKKMFVPSKDTQVLVQFDLARAEMCGLGSMAGDPQIKYAFESGLDLHKFVASKAFDVPYEEVTKDQRQQAKSIGFAIVYGSSTRSIAESNNITVAHVEEMLANFFKHFDRVQPWIHERHAEWREKGYVLGCLGKRINLPLSMSYEDGNGDIDRQAQNSPIQQMASDFNLMLWLRLEEIIQERGLDGKAVATVHDSLVYEVNAEEPDVVALITAYYDALKYANDFHRQFYPNTWIDMQGDCELGISWGELQECSVKDGQLIIIKE